ncbi:hypothetical protein CWE21_10630 [Pseudidiomarina aquimaris]|uniref:Uncharacterized protein n=1 Tax=Pseudidiomarina aquimaris TaxID=641841 RepID=A0A432XCZ5_9GAMM|nr:hypothetical protein CWE21_10630 [Pseudidiomarina aquimaris]
MPDIGWYLDTISGCDGDLDGMLYNIVAGAENCTFEVSFIEYPAFALTIESSIQPDEFPLVDEEITLSIGESGGIPQTSQISWELASRPDESELILADASSEKLSFVPDIEGRYELKVAMLDQLQRVLAEESKIIEVGPSWLPHIAEKTGFTELELYEDCYKTPNFSCSIEIFRTENPNVEEDYLGNIVLIAELMSGEYSISVKSPIIQPYDQRVREKHNAITVVTPKDSGFSGAWLDSWFVVNEGVGLKLRDDLEVSEVGDETVTKSATFHLVTTNDTLTSDFDYELARQNLPELKTFADTSFVVELVDGSRPIIKADAPDAYESISKLIEMTYQYKRRLTFERIPLTEEQLLSFSEGSGIPVDIAREYCASNGFEPEADFIACSSNSSFIYTTFTSIDGNIGVTVAAYSSALGEGAPGLSLGLYGHAEGIEAALRPNFSIVSNSANCLSQVPVSNASDYSYWNSDGVSVSGTFDRGESVPSKNEGLSFLRCLVDADSLDMVLNDGVTQLVLPMAEISKTKASAFLALYENGEFN